jgi:histidyl-tRNA synthetase
VDLKPPRGTADLLPPRSEALQSLTAAAARIATTYGYRYLETPALEGTELFTRSSGESSDIVRKEMYTFEDRGGRSVTLRPELTASIVRAYLAHRHDLPSPFKAYSLGSVWRYGRPQAGRLREFRQFDMEVIGEAGPAPDVEVISACDRYLRRDAGLRDLTLEVNSIGDDVCRPAYRKELLAYLEGHRDQLRDEHAEHFRDNPLRVLDCKDDACREVSKGAPRISDRLCGPCGEHFGAVRDGLEREGVAFVHQPLLVRGLDYYTRTAFEFVSPVLSQGQATVCGGGRYDGLAEALGGPPTPGVGFAAGLDRVLLALEKEGGLPVRVALDCFVVGVGDEGWRRAQEVLRWLRTAGIAADGAYEARPLKAQFRMAGRSGARFAVVVGDREAAAGTVTLRRLADGQEEELGLDEALARITTQGPTVVNE